MTLLIGEIFRRNAEVAPDAAAASLEERVLSHRELDEAGNRLANVLREMGVGHGDRIVTWVDTCLEILPLFVAAAKLGAVFAPLNARFAAAEVSPVARLARAKLLVTDAPRVADAATVAAEAGIPLVAHLAGEAGIPLVAHLAGGGPGVDLAAASAGAEVLAPEEPALR